MAPSKSELQDFSHSGAGRNPGELPPSSIMDPGLRRDDGGFGINLVYSNLNFELMLRSAQAFKKSASEASNEIHN
jgi:hypothetical protein